MAKSNKESMQDRTADLAVRLYEITEFVIKVANVECACLSGLNRSTHQKGCLVGEARALLNKTRTPQNTDNEPKTE
jgi:hypothetical protein